MRGHTGPPVNRPNHTASLTLGANNLSTTYSGIITGTGGTITKVEVGYYSRLGQLRRTVKRLSDEDRDQLGYIRP